MCRICKGIIRLDKEGKQIVCSCGLVEEVVKPNKKQKKNKTGGK